MPIRQFIVAGCLAGGIAVTSSSADVLDLVLVRSGATASLSGATVDDGPTAPPGLGQVGTGAWWIGGLAGAEFGITHLATLRGGAEWFVATDFSLGVQGDLGWAATEGDPGGLLVGVAPMLRWYFLRRESWSLFAEVGVGAAWTTVRIPEGGTRLNFTPQAAVGVVRDLGDDWRLRATLGWYHMSNARTGNNNPGLDALAVTIGVMRSF